MCSIVLCKSKSFGHEIEPVLFFGLEGQVLVNELTHDRTRRAVIINYAAAIIVGEPEQHHSQRISATLSTWHMAAILKIAMTS